MLIASPAFGQAPTSRILSKPEAAFHEPFSAVSGTRELRDGRVIVVDENERTVQLLDFSSGTARPIGRKGRGPGEYQLPSMVYALAGDTTAIMDEANRRFLLILPDGKPGKVVSMSPPGGGDLYGYLRWMDARGRMYSPGRPYVPVPGGVKSLDSVPILRWTAGASKTDTVAWFGLPPNLVKASTRGKAQEIRVGVPPFTSQDAWALASDGRIAVLESDTYGVTWYNTDGTVTRPAPFGFERMRVTEAHKEEWKERQRGGMAIIGDGDNGTYTMVPRQKNRDPEPVWPEFLPPFSGEQAARFALDGSLWVKRTGPARTPPNFDVIDRNGLIVQRVVLPARTRLVGFGANGAIYVVRINEDDQEFLERYRLN